MKPQRSIQFLNNTPLTHPKTSILTLFIAMLIGLPNPAWALRGGQCGNDRPVVVEPVDAAELRRRESDDSIDSDNDGFADVVDPCPTIARVKHEDSDRDGVGNECDPCPSVYGKDEGCPLGEVPKIVELPKQEVHPSKQFIDAKMQSCNVMNGPPSFLLLLFSLLLFITLKAKNAVNYLKR